MALSLNPKELLINWERKKKNIGRKFFTEHIHTQESKIFVPKRTVGMSIDTWR